MKKAEKNWIFRQKKRFLINFLYVAIIGAITIIICRFLLFRMFPFLLSLIVAALSQRPSVFLSAKTGLKKPICAMLLAAGIYLGLFCAILFLAYRLIISSVGLIEYLPEIFSTVGEWANGLANMVSDYLPEKYNFSLDAVLENILKNLTSTLTNLIKKAVTATPSLLLSSVVALVASCYIAKDFDGLARFLKSIISEKIYERFLRIKAIFTTSIFKILKGYVILLIITFLELWLGFIILKIKNAYIWAFLIALIDFLPVLGTGIIMIPWAVYCAISGNTSLSVGLAVLYIIVVIIRNFIEPKIVSQQIGINPLFTLFTMYLGLKLFGGAGLIILPLIFIVTIKYYKEDTI